MNGEEFEAMIDVRYWELCVISRDGGGKGGGGGGGGEGGGGRRGRC